jgi:trans-aconitate methyltransferase
VTEPLQENYLDKLQDRYLQPTPDRQVDQRLMELLADTVIPRLHTRRLLELGVGDQIWTPRLCAAIPEVVTLDGSAQLLEAMRAKISSPGWTPVHTMFEDYLPEQRFDCVLATFIFEHVQDPLRILKLAAESWLVPGGTIHVAVPHALSLHRRLAVLMGLSSHVAELGPADARLEHTFCYTCFEMEKLLVEAGFRSVKKEGFNCKTLPNRYMEPLSDEQLRGLFWLGHELPIEYAATIYLQAQLP